MLSIGQCSPDHSSLTALCEKHFEVTIETADSHADAIQKAGDNEYDLILVNRILDATGTEGMKIIRELKNGESSAAPLMLVSNYPESQTEAVAAGAVQGFGKAALDEQTTIDLLAIYLGKDD